MGTITKGRELSMWETIAIGLATSKNPNPQTGKNVRFAILTLRNAKYPATPVHREIIFEDDDPTLIATLETLKVQDPNDNERFIIPINKIGVEVEAIEDDWGDPVIFKTKVDPESPHGKFMRKYILWPGARLMPMKLRGGMHYANDADGRERTRKNRLTGQAEVVKTDTVNVFVQVDYIMQGEDGNMETTYVDSRDPESQLKRIQDRFFIKPVEVPTNTTVATTVPAEEAKVVGPELNF